MGDNWREGVVPRTHECDVLVIGSGAGGFASAITARKAGLDVLMVEKANVFGGTTATSGGIIWIPANPLATRSGVEDNLEDCRLYLRRELGNAYSPALIEAYLQRGPEMVTFFVDEIGIPFTPLMRMPDYHPEQPGASRGGRSLQVVSVHASILGDELKRLRPLPPELSLFGMGVSSGSDLRHLYKFGRSLESSIKVAKLLAKFGYDKLRHGRGMSLVNGNALIARLARALFDLGTPLWTSAPASELLREGQRVVGAVVIRNGQPIEVRARRGTILASGGFAQNPERRSAVYSHPAGAEEHISLTAPGNIGDGARMAESMGGFVDTDVQNCGAWMPVSRVPRSDGTWGAILHSVNHGKPGMISVLRNGKRFADESLSYHDLVAKMVAAPEVGKPAGAFIVCDHNAFSRFGLGYAKPFLPLRNLIEAGYLIKADSIRDLARKAEMDPDVLETTVNNYNVHAKNGEDPEFGKGKNAYGQYLGDDSYGPNPNIAPLAKPPFYAVWMHPGDIGNFAGIKTDEHAHVLRRDGSIIEGLFAIGNDMASVFRGRYPGGGSLIGPAMTFGFIAARYLASQSSSNA
jgi:succinate dehydrogenase/fumarate reductase flavoprotein subunit